MSNVIPELFLRALRIGRYDSDWTLGELIKDFEFVCRTYDSPITLPAAYYLGFYVGVAMRIGEA
ncbi:MAG: hypothetical protein AUF65_01605 [Chloroflexi bacterium 13_1_20CM_50_12]|nr:MAG: hypothetical protein AUF65_01605 [Chloroflexi bacterium 13_1_20CM_50_12]